MALLWSGNTVDSQHTGFTIALVIQSLDLFVLLIFLD